MAKSPIDPKDESGRLANRWEYRVEPLGMSADPDMLTRKFSNLGEDGWELVATRPVVTAVGSHWDWLAIFKRPAGAAS